MGILNIFKQKDLPRPNSISTEEPNIKELQLILKAWLRTPLREEQLLAEKYYDGEHDILYREKKMIGRDGNLVTINNVPNNKLIDNQYRKLVDQKTNYVLGKPISIATEDEHYLELLNKVFSKNVHRQLRVLAQNAVDGGIAWLHPYCDEDGNFKLMVFPSYEICPIWKDKSHTELEMAIRYYSEQVIAKNGSIEEINHADVYTNNGVYCYITKNKHWVQADVNWLPYLMVDKKPLSWKKLPIIPFKYNSKEIPLIRNVKSLQDALNQVLSDFQNNMEEDPRTSLLVLKNYDGTDLGEFRQNVATFGVVKVTTVDGVQGGVDTLKIEVNEATYQAMLMQLKRAIIENGRGFDAKEERMDGDPNQMNIESMYTDIDLDVNAMETEFQAGFNELKWFIDQYLILQNEEDYTDHDVEFVFNRDIFINEDAKIDNCVKSLGIISRKTTLARHPWVTNVNHELQELEADEQAELEKMDATLTVQEEHTKNNKPEPSNGGDE